jgi:ATP-dependent DNA helicase RecG
VIPSPQEEKELFYAASNIPFDDRPNLAADISDLDIGLMRTHLKEIGSNLYPYSLSMDAVQIAKDLQLVDGPSENLKPLNVGILMFSERPERYFRYARIEIVDIPDPTGTNMVEKIFTGPIQRQLKDALAYLKNYVLKEVTIKAPDKAEAVRISNYPYAALEEILANAVYHRSYQVNEPITVRITPDSIEITSFPGFDRSITDAAIERLDIRARIYRNRRIGDFLKELKLIEGRNTGFPNARKALDSNGSPSLQFDMNPERDYLSVTIPVHSYFSQQTEKSEKAVAYEKQILSCLSSPLSLTELAHAMGYKSITAKLRNTLTELQQSGKIRIVAIDHSVKYTL